MLPHTKRGQISLNFAIVFVVGTVDPLYLRAILTVPQVLLVQERVLSQYILHKHTISIIIRSVMPYVLECAKTPPPNLHLRFKAS
jgi:hypothetical protein